MATGPQAFYCLWQEERIREKLFGLLSKEDICSVRQTNSACCNLVTKRLFLRTHLTFTANTFTKPSRVSALSEIGHHIEHLTFHMPHSDATFLPPLIHPLSGHEITFLYTPYTSMGSALARPKYANSELGEILTQQYPPLFHAATNVPSFIHAIKHLPNLRHLTVKCPGQDAKERYRRDIVDYALISLRIALERAPLTKLNKLSLSCVHPSAFNYLRHLPGFGCRPSAGRRWRQIRKLHITVESWDFYGPSPGLDHLKILDDYIRNFSSTLEKFTFTWAGRKGPCPISLAADPLFSPPRSSKKLFHEVTSPMSPLPPPPVRKPIYFPKLRYLTVRNATMTVPQVAEIVSYHKPTVREFDFENVALVGGGSWEDALAPLTDHADGSSVWSRSSAGFSEAGSYRTAPSVHPDDPGMEIPSPSAAVSAVARDLLDIDIDGFLCGLQKNYPSIEEGDEAERPDVPDIGQHQEAPSIVEEEPEPSDDLAPDIAAAREASGSYSTKVTKKRLHKKRRKHRNSTDGEEEDGNGQESPGGGHRHRQESRSRSQSSHRHHRRHRHQPSKHSLSSHHSTPTEPDIPEVTEDSLPSSPTTVMPRLDISAPLLAADPPMLLKPTVYDPMLATAAAMHHRETHGDDGITSVQRNIEREEAQRLLAEDVVARTSALRKAKEAVLMKLSKEFCRRKTGNDSNGGFGFGCGAGVGVGAGVGSAAPVGAGPSQGPGSRFRDGLFGRSAVNVGHDHRSLDSNSALVPLMFSRS